MTKQLLIILFLLIPLLTQAQGDIHRGKIKSQTCIACHDQKSSGKQPLAPDLALQHAPYIMKQLEDFTSGKRSHPLMESILAGLTPEDRADLAVYYADLQKMPQKKHGNNSVESGARLYRSGDARRGIIACIACHGPDGRGNAHAGFPALAGQKASYTIAQMQAFKMEKRKNDVQQIMRDISKRMEQADIEALAYYLEGL